MKKIILLIIIFFGLSVYAETSTSDIKMVTMYYAFEELENICSTRHPGTINTYKGNFNEWKENNSDAIKMAFNGLEAEAKKDPEKRRKLAGLEEYIKMAWSKNFEEVHESISLNMCSINGYAEELFMKSMIESK